MNHKLILEIFFDSHKYLFEFWRPSRFLSKSKPLLIFLIRIYFPADDDQLIYFALSPSCGEKSIRSKTYMWHFCLFTLFLKSMLWNFKKKLSKFSNNKLFIVKLVLRLFFNLIWRFFCRKNSLGLYKVVITIEIDNTRLNEVKSRSSLIAPSNYTTVEKKRSNEIAFIGFHKCERNAERESRNHWNGRQHNNSSTYNTRWRKHQ